MAETLGSLVDKLTIKDIRQFHLQQMLKEKNLKFSRHQLQEKLAILKRQKLELMAEINAFVAAAVKGKIRLRDEKLKLYNALEHMGRILSSRQLGEVVSELAKKNLELWHLEDEARRKDVSLSYIGKIKGKIDFANQQRNDLIDKIDELFKNIIKKVKKKTR